MKNIKITEATFSGDLESVDFTIYDADSPFAVKNNTARLNVKVGEKNWEEESEECNVIINKSLLEKGLKVVNDYIIE